MLEISINLYRQLVVASERWLNNSEADDGVAVRRHFQIMCQQAKRFRQGLGDEHSVEWVGVQVGEVLDG